jgi:hypothetical protein
MVLEYSLCLKNRTIDGSGDRGIPPHILYDARLQERFFVSAKLAIPGIESSSPVSGGLFCFSEPLLLF